MLAPSTNHFGGAIIIKFQLFVSLAMYAMQIDYDLSTKAMNDFRANRLFQNYLLHIV